MAGPANRRWVVKRPSEDQGKSRTRAEVTLEEDRQVEVGRDRNPVVWGRPKVPGAWAPPAAVWEAVPPVVGWDRPVAVEASRRVGTALIS
jgi:hypothetical protein